MKTSLSPAVLQTAANAKVQAALDHIQQAQNELGSACAELSSLVGAIPQWKRASKLYDEVHAFWYRVEGLRNQRRVYLDSINVEALEKRMHAHVHRAQSEGSTLTGPPTE